MYQAYGWHTVPLTVEVISESARSWLTQSGSLTEQLKQQSVPHRLTLWRQGLEVLPIHEQLLLRQALPGMAWVRQVYLMLGAEVVVYGRTIVPEAIYLKHQDALDNLGTKPIGEYFLYREGWARSQFTFGCITPAGLLHESATQGGPKHRVGELADTILSARRSTFTVDSGLILLTEVFLPAINAFQPVKDSTIVA